MDCHACLQLLLDHAAVLSGDQHTGYEADLQILLQVVEKTRKYLLYIGDFISEVAAARGRNSQRNVQRLRLKLWQV